MHDILMKYEVLSESYQEKKRIHDYTKQNLSELLEQSFHSILNYYMNIADISLDNGLSLSEYMALAAKDCRETFRKYFNEDVALESYLKKLYSEILNIQESILRCSGIKIGYLLALLYAHKIPFLITDSEITIGPDVISFDNPIFYLVSFKEGHLVIDPVLYQIYGEDTESFIAYYINRRYNENNNLSIIEAWDNYRQDNLELV